MSRVSTSCIGIPFGLAFMLMGGVAFWFMLMEVRAIWDTQSWEGEFIDLRSVEVEYPKRPPPSDEHDIYELVVEYTYEYNGNTYTSTNYRRQSFRSSSYEKMALVRRDLMNSGDGLSAYVNPDDPSQAILEKESMWFALILPFPLIFVLVGTVFVLASLPIWGSPDRKTRNRRSKRSDSPGPEDPAAENQGRHHDRGGPHDG